MPFVSFDDRGRPNNLPLRFWNMTVEATPQGPSKNRRVPRPAIVNKATLGDGPIRDTFVAQGSRVTVSGTKVYWNLAHVGDVPPTGAVRHAVSDEQAVIVVHKRSYIVTSSTVVVNPAHSLGLPQVADVIFKSGRFIYFHSSSDGEFSWSATNDATSVDGTAFASAESSPDALLGGMVQGDNLIMAGANTFEWWYDNDDIDAPFIRSKGRRYDKGAASAASMVLADNATHWVGNDRIIYRAGAVPQRISNEDIEDLLELMSAAEFAAISGFRAIYRGHTFVVWNFPGQGTWAYDVGQKDWARWTTWGQEQFRVSCGARAGDDDDTVVGDSLSGQLMTFDGGTFTDLGDPIERVVSAFIPIAGGVQRNTNIALHCSKGVGLPDGYGSDPVVEMRYSDHEGGDFTNWMESTLGAIGDRSKTALAHWVGLGSFQAPGRLCEFRCTDPVYYSCYQVAYNELRP